VRVIVGYLLAYREFFFLPSPSPSNSELLLEREKESRSENEVKIRLTDGIKNVCAVGFSEC
jgi:hypothetical protein